VTVALLKVPSSAVTGVGGGEALRRTDLAAIEKAVKAGGKGKTRSSRMKTPVCPTPAFGSTRVEHGWQVPPTAGLALHAHHVVVDAKQNDVSATAGPARARRGLSMALKAAMSSSELGRSNRQDPNPRAERLAILV